ncbi:hypothetical protein AOLI_G00320510 [Acnodon oligacanthus]
MHNTLASVVGPVWFPLDRRPGGRFVCESRPSHRREKGAGHSHSTPSGLKRVKRERQKDRERERERERERVSCESSCSPTLARVGLERTQREPFECLRMFAVYWLWTKRSSGRSHQPSREDVRYDGCVIL